MIAGLSFLVVAGLFYFFFGRDGSAPKTTVSEPEGSGNTEVATPSSNTFTGKGPLWALGLIGIIVLGFWIRGETRPNSLGYGRMLLDGDTIVIEKYTGKDFSELQKYSTPAERYPLVINTHGKDVKMLVWDQVGGEWVLNTPVPIAYEGGVLCRTSVKTFSLFLDKKSKTKKIKDATITVDKTVSCDFEGGFTPIE